MPRRDVHPAPRGIFTATPVDTSKRRIRDRDRPPANKAAQSSALSLRTSDGSRDLPRHPCVAKTS
jgi:hypothetical protein